MRAFYFPNNGVLCGSCGWQCYPDSESNLAHRSKEAGDYRPIFHCTNDACPQQGVKFRVKPIEVEVVE
jgi:hypothetical protein